LVVLLLRALRWRTAASLAVLVVAAVAVGGAALGPLYVRSAEESFLLDRVAGAADVPFSTDLELRATTVTQPPSYTPDGKLRPIDIGRLNDEITQRLSSLTALDPWYGPAGGWITVPPAAVHTLDGRTLGEARTSWHPGACAGMQLVTGRCPAADDEVLVSDRLLDQNGLRIGSTLLVDLTPPPQGPASAPTRADARAVTVVGTYRLGSADPQVWGPTRPAEYTEKRDKLADKLFLDEILLQRNWIRKASGEASTTVFRLLRPGLARTQDLDAAGNVADRESSALAAHELVAIQSNPQQMVFTVHAGMPSFLADLAGERRQLQVTGFAVTAQLVVLSWFVLFVVVSATSEERAAEVALAKLRGLSPWQTLRFGFAESGLLLVVAAPVGLLAGWALVRLLITTLPLPRTAALLDGPTWVATGLGLIGALVAALLALRRMLTTPVLDELRRTGGTRAALARTVAVDAAALTLAAEGVYLLRTGNDNPAALVSPGLLAVAAGLLTVRLLPWGARVAVRWTAASLHVATFLAVRNVARRPGGARLVVLVTIAAALGVFSVSTWTVSRDTRADQARQEVGAATVLHVTANSPTELARLVERADPSGRWAMAAAQLDRTSTGPVLGVQTERLAAVTVWDPAWADTAFPALTTALHPARPAPILVRGRVVLTGRGLLGPGGAPVLLLQLQQQDGIMRTFDLGPLRSGTARYTTSLDGCGQGCRLRSLVLKGPGLGTRVSNGGLLLTGVEDSGGTVDASLRTASAWRVQPRQGSIGEASEDARSAEAGPDGLKITYSGLLAHDDVVVEVADRPVPVPAVSGPARQTDPDEHSPNAFHDSGLSGASIVLRRVATGALPRVGRTGVMADLVDLAEIDQGAWLEVDYQVWLAGGAPQQVRDGVTRLGARTVAVETLAARRAELDRDAGSLAVLLTLAAALVGVVLVLSTVLATAYVGGRRRAYELAALGSLGASRRLLVRAGSREQVFLVLIGTVVGTVVGFAGTLAVLAALPGVTLAATTPVQHEPRLLPVVAVILVALLLVAAVAHLGARRIVAAASADLLRESQA
jgi:putative ABC transport system permease protein